MSELEQYKRSQHQVFGEFLHEIKTPLAIMRTHLESEITNEAIPLEVRQKLVLDVEEIARANQLLQDMRVLLDGEHEDFRKDFKNESLLELVMDVIETLGPQAQEKKQKLSLVCEENVHINMNVYKLKQLFFNLISNAIKYTPEDNEISISFNMNDEKVCVKVIDKGIGIMKEDQEKIFEAFYRVDNQKYEGTGLGLAVCMAIAKMHNTEVKIKSKLDIGSEFSICFKR